MYDTKLELIQEQFISKDVKPYLIQTIVSTLEPKSETELAQMLSQCSWTNEDKKTIQHPTFSRPLPVYGANGKLKLSKYAIELIEYSEGNLPIDMEEASF